MLYIKVRGIKKVGHFPISDYIMRMLLDMSVFVIRNETLVKENFQYFSPRNRFIRVAKRSSISYIFSIHSIIIYLSKNLHRMLKLVYLLTALHHGDGDTKTDGCR